MTPRDVSSGSFGSGPIPADPSWPARKRELGARFIRELYRERILQTWLRDRAHGWELVSGKWSPFYFGMRYVPSRPELYALAVDGGVNLLVNEAPSGNRIIGLAATGIPLAAAVGYVAKVPMGFTRKLPGVRTLADLQRESTNYGGHSLVEGDFSAGDRIVVFDDVVSRFDSKEVAISQIQMELQSRQIRGAQIEAVAVLVDRGKNTIELAAKRGFKLVTLLHLATEGLDALSGEADPREIEVIRDYLNDDERFQASHVREDLMKEAQAKAASRER